MASFAEEITDFLATQSTGATIYCNEWPAAAEPGAISMATTAVVIERPGGEGYRHSPPVVSSFDIWVRGDGYPTTYAAAAKIFNSLNSDTRIQLPTHRVMSVICQTPGGMGRDDQNRQLIKMGATMKIVPNDQSAGSAGKGGGIIHPESP